MGVYDQVFGFVIVTGDVYVSNSFSWQLIEEFIGIIAVVDAVNVDVVDIQVQQTIGFIDDMIDEVYFRHVRIGLCQVIRNILQRHALAQDVLHSHHAFRHVVSSGFSEWYGHQIIQLSTVSAVRQMF